MADGADGTQLWADFKAGATLNTLVAAALQRRLLPSLPRLLMAARAEGVNLVTFATQYIAAVRATGEDGLADYVTYRALVIRAQIQSGNLPAGFTTQPYTPLR